MKKVKRFVYKKLLNFVEYLIKKFDVQEQDILERYAKLKQNEANDDNKN